MLPTPNRCLCFSLLLFLFVIMYDHVSGYNCLPHKWHMRLECNFFFSKRLVVYGLVDLKVKGDGNCQVCVKDPSFFFHFAWSHLTASICILWSLKQFRALSDQFYRTPEHHRFVRQQVVKQVSVFEKTSFVLAMYGFLYANAFHW